MMTLITGASGFLGRAIAASFPSEDIITLSRSGAMINIDLSQNIPDLPKLDLVIHCAGKAHVIPKTADEHEAFFNINVKGTQNLICALERTGELPKSFVFISSVSVYGKTEGTLINEESPLLAKDAYGMSKIHAEQVIQEWCGRNGVICTILRLPLIAGPNPPGNLKAMIRGIQRGYYTNVGAGQAKKSIVMVQDVAAIIPVAASIGGIYNLTDGKNPSFFELSNVIAQQLRKSNPKNIPLWLARIFAWAGDLAGEKFPLNSSKLKKIISELTFDDSRAVEILGWKPTAVIKGFKIK